MNTAADSSLLPVAERVLRRARLPWYRRVVGSLSSYLPLLLMAMLALATLWLVKNTPIYQGEKAAVAPKHVPDYTMRDFTVQRFGADGVLRLQIEGDALRHYPDTDTTEIDNARIRSITPEGRVTLASAQQALANGDASEVQLTGNARVVREAFVKAGAAEETVDFRGEFLHAFLRTEEVRSHLPVTITRGTTQLRGSSMTYDNLDRVAKFAGRVQATFGPPGSAAPASSPAR